MDYPEVYTRERLLFDRAEQARWLRTQLEKSYLDTLQFGIEGSRDQRFGAQSRSSVGLNYQTGGIPLADDTALEPAAPPTLTTREAANAAASPLASRLLRIRIVLGCSASSGSSAKPTSQLRDLDIYNENLKPFVWHKAADVNLASVVRAATKFT